MFNSLDFLLFFPAVVVAYFAVPHRARWALLLGASYVFYGWWRVEYLSLILASTLVDYVAALRMGRHAERSRRRPWLLLSLTCNLGLLFAFKLQQTLLPQGELFASKIQRIGKRGLVFFLKRHDA